MKLALVLVAGILVGCAGRRSTGTSAVSGDGGPSTTGSDGTRGRGTPGSDPDGAVTPDPDGPGGGAASSGDRSRDGAVEADGIAVSKLDATLVVDSDVSDARGADAVGNDDGGAPLTPAFHQRLPLSSAVLTSRQPTFGWTDTGDVDYFILEVCTDVLCSDVLERGFTGLTSYTLTKTLEPGVVYWRVKAMLPNGGGVLETPIWEAFVPWRSAPQDTSMLAFPDFDRDGRPDVAQAAEGGSVVVSLFGASHAPRGTSATLSGPARALAYAGDINADGYGDLLVGRDGAVDVYYGGAAGVSRVTTLTGSTGFGGRLAAAGDVNGDGLGDVLIGSSSEMGAGAAQLFLSSRAGLGKPSGAPLPEGRFGAAGDVNSDGYGDVVGCSPTTGAAHWYAGARAGLRAAGTLVDPRGSGAGSFGSACQGVGDVNGDGHGDVVVTGSSSTELLAFVFLGGDKGFVGSPTSLVLGPAAGRGPESIVVASAGDVNRDGYTDVLVTTGNDVRLFLGGSGGLQTTAIATLPGDFRTAAGLGDIDGDGASDLLLGPRGCDQPVRLYAGAAAGFGSELFTFPMTGTPLCPQHLLAR